MEMLRNGSPLIRWAAPGALLLVALVYLSSLPHSVQTGDSGELVSSAFFLRVPHPSGYPLFVWLEHFCTRLLPVGSVFFRASLLNAVFAILALGFLASRSRHLSSPYRMAAIGVLWVLASSETFWRYSVTPEVFSLNQLLAAAMIWLYLDSERPARARASFATILFFVGLANHLTLVFLFPLLLHLWIEARGRGIVRASAIGIAACLALYASLLFMNPRDFYSWGKLDQASGVLSHFLREDYGRSTSPRPTTTRFLSPASRIRLASAPVGRQFLKEVESSGASVLGALQSKEALHSFGHFFKVLLNDFSPILSIAAICLLLRAVTPRMLALLLCFLLHIGFVFGQIRIPLSLHGDPIVERFHLLPELIACFMAIEGLRTLDLRRRARALPALIALAALIAAGLNFARYRTELDFSRNTIVEDYALNLLSELSGSTRWDARPIVLADDDTTYFSLRYAQQVYGASPDVLVLSAPLLTHPWYIEKIRDRAPNFRFDPPRGPSRFGFSLEADLIRPNVEAGNPLLTAGRYSDSSAFRVTDLALGTRLELGRGRSADPSGAENFRFRSGTEELQSDPAKYDIYRDLYSRYAVVHLTLAKLAFEAGNTGLAVSESKKALQKVPYCLPALSNLCSLEGSKECSKTLESLRSEVHDYYE